jgi:hypothetical protein
MACDGAASSGKIVEYYRIDVGRRMTSALALGAAVMTVGLLLVTVGTVVARPSRAAFLADQARDAAFRGTPVDAAGAPLDLTGTGPFEIVLGILGVVSLVVGGLIAITRLNALLREDRYLALRTDGAYFQDGDDRVLLLWEDVEAVRYDADADAVRFEQHDGAVWDRHERFAGMPLPELARRASEIRRKALFGLL